MKSIAKCAVCGSEVETTLSDRDIVIANHVRKAHPAVYEEAHELAVQIKLASKEIYELTGSRHINFFLP
jgi:hypothetical protein